MNVINGWVAKFGVRAISSDNRVGWKRHHMGLGQFIKPYADGDFKESWRKCPAKECVLLFERRLWKCPQTASLHLAAEKFSPHSIEERGPYLAYNGIGVTCYDAALEFHS